jgi:ADP-ribose diphosphatase
MAEKPVILNSKIVARTRVFEIEQLDLRFSNGNEVVFERLRGSPRGAVLVVPVLNDDTLLLVREYATGLDRYELAFPKGLIDEGESSADTANRELKEEIGYGARIIEPLTTMSTAPGYHSHITHVFLARDLYPEKLPGDEPEPIEVIPWKLSDMDALLKRDDFTEARSIAALYMVRDLLG